MAARAALKRLEGDELCSQATGAPIAVARPYMPSAAQLQPYLQRIDASRWYSNFGPLATELESRLAARFGQDVFAVSVANGTLGLALALNALGAKPGQRCIMASWTFVATAHAALQAGLTPWFADVDAQTATLSPTAVRAMLEAAPGQVGAVVVTAPFGLMPELGAWADLQAETGVAVLVDGAAAFDAGRDARLPVMVSLHATKTLGVGEGGFIATSDEGLAARVRELSVFGFNGSRESRVAATNAKLSEYGAAVGLAALDVWPTTRLMYLRAAQRLRMALARTPEVAFQAGWGIGWVSSVCTVGLPDGSSDRIEGRLRAQGIDTRRWWSRGCHVSPAFAALPRGELTQTERLADATLGIPYAADLDAEEIERIADALMRAVAQG